MEPLRGGQLATNIPQKFKQHLTGLMWKIPCRVGFKMGLEPSGSIIGLKRDEHHGPGKRKSENCRRSSAKYADRFRVKCYRSGQVHFWKKLKVNCTGCGYCLPCPSGVDIPENFAKYNDYFLFGSPETKEEYQFHYQALIMENEMASSCIKCGACEEHCPQHIPIIQELKKVKELYEWINLISIQMRL